MSSLEALTLKDSSLVRIQLGANVVFSVLNSYSRRSSKDSRAIGTLLGEVKDGVITITECYAVPVTEFEGDKNVTNHVAINKDYNTDMFGFHRRNNKKEVIVGWYATTTSKGEFINDNSSLIHEYYSHEIDNPIHLVVDTTLLGDKISVRGFVGRETSIGDEVVANSFQEVKVDIQLTDYEATILHYSVKGQTLEQGWKKPVVTAPLPKPATAVTDSLTKLQSILDSLQTYVDGVVEGKIVPDRETGVAISDTLNTVGPQMLSALQANSLQQRYQDLLMISYLSTLAQTQTLVAEKLNQIL